MSSVSTLRKIGMITRFAAKQAGRNRRLAALWQAGRTTVASVGKVLHQLWLEVTGFIFLTIAGVGVFAGVRELTKYRAGETGLSRVLIAIVFTVTFAWFGFSSFWTVRKKNEKV